MNPMGHHSEEELTVALNRGDRKAFEIIYRTYAADLFRIIQRNVTIREDCEEILHDVFEQLWTKHRQVKIISLQWYLRRMVHNRIVSFFRSKQVRARYEKHFLLFEAIYDHLDEQELENIDSATLRSFLKNNLSQLPERCQAAFRLRLNGFSNGEIAERMSIKKVTVENYIVKAIGHLRACFKTVHRTG